MNNNFYQKGKVLLFLLLAVTSLAKAQQWKELQMGVTEDLYDVCCIDTNDVLFCGQNGMILKTTDGGQTWERKNSHVQADLHKLEFANESVGFACGDNVFLKTTDGGENWNELESDTVVCFDYDNIRFLGQTNLFLVDADTLYVMDCMNGLWKSTDGGETFEMMFDLQSTLGDYWKFDMYFEDNIGYLVGYSDWIWFFWENPELFAFKTQDYGRTWSTIEFPECRFLVSTINFMDKDRIRLYGYFATNPDDYYGIFETTDGMESYSLQQPTEPFAGLPDPWGLGRYVTFTSANYGCLIYNLVTVKEQSDFCSYAFLTQDNGETWTSVPDGINWRNYLYAVDGVDTVFYIAASDGYAYKTGTADVIYPYGLEERKSALKVFPNPAVESITITIPSDIDVLDSDLSTVELSTISGQIVMQNTFRGNSTILDINSLPIGLYLLNLRNGRSSFVEKIMKQ